MLATSKAFPQLMEARLNQTKNHSIMLSQKEVLRNRKTIMVLLKPLYLTVNLQYNQGHIVLECNNHKSIKSISST